MSTEVYQDTKKYRHPDCNWTPPIMSSSIDLGFRLNQIFRERYFLLFRRNSHSFRSNLFFIKNFHYQFVFLAWFQNQISFTYLIIYILNYLLLISNWAYNVCVFLWIFFIYVCAVMGGCFSDSTLSCQSSFSNCLCAKENYNILTKDWFLELSVCMYRLVSKITPFTHMRW